MKILFARQSLNIQIIIKQYVRLFTMLDAQISDLEFYLMKINRLQSDLSATQNELITARLRLRTAEDYQIKYELLLKQSDQEQERSKLYEREQEQKIAELITLKIQERDSYWADRCAKLEKQHSEKYSRELARIGEEFGAFRKKHERCGNKFDEQDLLAFKNKKLLKEVEALEEKIQAIKRESEKSKESEIKQIRESLEAKSKEKQENQRKIYREKIESLQSIIIGLEKDLLQAKTKADPKREKQIDRLKSQLTLQINKTREQIEKINTGFIDKNGEIEQMLKDRYKIQENLIRQKKDLKEYIKQIEDKLFQKQKQHQMELINLKERMSRIREQEVEGLKIQILKIEQSFKEERDSWNIVIADKDKQIERIKNKSDDDSQRHKDDKAKQLKKIEELKQRLKEHEGERQAGETEHLLNSMKEISAKEEDFNNYENGVTFLDRQLKKAITKIEQKNIEINKLIKELNDLRKESEDQINSLREKSRKDKKYYGDKIGQLQQQIRHLNEQIRSKDRQAKKKEKDLESKINLLTKESTSLKDLIEQMQKDYTRAIDNKKAVQASYREEREKGLTSKSDLTMVKKQKWLEMERQKNQLEVIFKEKEEQMRNRHEIQMDKLRHERDQLKSENELLKGLVESSKKQGDENKENKQALYTEYHKKMATLNLEIALTKNIYDSLVHARSRKPRESKISQFDRIDQDASNSDQNQQANPIPNSSQKEPQFMNYSDIEKLTMSFNPNKK